MGLKRVCAIGHYDSGANPANGQTIKTRTVTEELERCLGKADVLRLDTRGGAAALLDTEYNASVVEKIICTRERTVKELKKLGFTMPESKANFVFITHERMRAEELYRKLREKGILTRYFAQARIDNYLRVSIGTDDEMDAFLKAVREILAEK